jgi:hypothetical protein
MKKIADFLFRPRYLRAIPSLMVLTTAMAWGVAPDSDSVDTLQKRAGVTLSLNHAAAGAGALDKPGADEPVADNAGDVLAG